MIKTHYDTLGVAHNATTKEIKTAYRQLCLQTHPDVAGPTNLERFKAIANAHDILSNPRQRQMYDKELRYRSTWGGSHSNSGSRQQQQYRSQYPHDLRSQYYQRAQHDFARRARASSSSSASSAASSMFGRGGLSAPTVVSVGLGLVLMWWLAPTVTEDRSLSAAQFRPAGSIRSSGYGENEVVEAWKNPDTGFWEQPAPWDPTYRGLQPKLVLVPRHQVRQRSL